MRIDLLDRRVGTPIFFIERCIKPYLRQIILRLAGWRELAQVERFALGGEFLLAGGPIACAAPIFLGVKEDQQDREDGDKACEPDQRVAEKALHGQEQGRGQISRVASLGGTTSVSSAGVGRQSLAVRRMESDVKGLVSLPCFLLGYIAVRE